MRPWIGLSHAGLLVVILVAACSPTSAPSALSSDPEPTPVATNSPTERPSPDPEPTASPTERPTPSASLRPALRYPEEQSYGAATIAFTTPAIDPVTITMACEWTSPTEVGSFYPDGPVMFRGESVWIEINPRAASPRMFSIGREDAASYWPGRKTGDVVLAETTPDWSAGTIRFDHLAPDPESAGPGPIPTPLADWVRPIADDPSMARLSGTVTWTCEPPPPTVVTPPPRPVHTPKPERPLPPIPSLTLVDGDRNERGLDGCPSSFRIDGFEASTDCGPSFRAPGSKHIVPVHVGDTLRFTLPGAWRFSSWEVGRVAQSEAVRWRGEVPDTYGVVAKDGRPHGQSFETAAPPVGDWTILVSWTAVRDDDEIAWSDYFRVVVER